MRASGFISRRLQFRGRLAEAAVALSFLVVTLAVAVSAGFRKEIRGGVRDRVGDLRIVDYNNIVDVDSSAISLPEDVRGRILALDGVEGMRDAVLRAGVVKQGETVHGVLVKGVDGGAARFLSGNDTLAPLSVAIPDRLSRLLGVGAGDPLLTYFVGEKVKVRKFRVAAVYDGFVETDGQLTVYADIADLRRLNLWEGDRSSAVEILLSDRLDPVRDGAVLRGKVQDILEETPLEEAYPFAITAADTFPQLFAWLDLIDMNVLILLVLMGVVAGFNMISGLLIMLLRNIPTIGMLKTLGMRNGPLARAFLGCAARTVLRGLVAGNVLALILCLVQGATHWIKLNPENYFVSFVPVALDGWYLLLANLAAFAIAMLMVLLPLLMIARVDPAETVKGNL